MLGIGVSGERLCHSSDRHAVATGLCYGSLGVGAVGDLAYEAM